MAVVPTPPTFSSGTSSSSQLNQLRDALNYALNPPRAVLRQTVAQSVTGSTWQSLTFDVEDLDAYFGGTGQHDTATNTSRFTAVYAGWYFLGGATGFVSNSTGIRGARWAVNGAALNGAQSTVGAFTPALSIEVAAAGRLLFLSVGDYVELQGFQSSGGALNTTVTANEQSNMSVVWESNS